MAEVRVVKKKLTKTVMKPVTEEYTKKEVILTLDAQEAVALCMVSGCIIGSSEGFRGAMDMIFHKLSGEVIKSSRNIALTKQYTVNPNLTFQFKDTPMPDCEEYISEDY